MSQISETENILAAILWCNTVTTCEQKRQLGHRQNKKEIAVGLHAEERDFPFSKTRSRSFSPNQLPIRWVSGGHLPLGVKRLERKSHTSPPSSAEIKNIRIHSSTPPIRLHDTVLHYAQDRLCQSEDVTVDTSLGHASVATRLNSLLQCFSNFVRPLPGKFFFRKTRARSQHIYSSAPFQNLFKFTH